MRKCASCGCELGAAFATSPICPRCDRRIDGGPLVESPPVEEFPPLADVLQLIASRAATEPSSDAGAPAALATPAVSPAPAAVTTYLTPAELQILTPKSVDGGSPETTATIHLTSDAAQAATTAKVERSTHVPSTPTRPDLPPPDAASGSAGSPPRDPNLVTGLWSGTVDGSAHERMTMRAGGEVDEVPGLVVNSRVLTHRGTSAADADYQLLDTIGEGGIGVVYAARQASIDRTVAIKMLKAQEVDPHQRAKFLSEAVVTGELDHPNIVPIYDLGTNQQGSLFYSMKRVRGTPWNKVLDAKSLVENLEILMKIADAVAFAHSRGVIHRDLKPENVMLGDFGEVLLMDWGLALQLPDARRNAAALHDPGMGGTPAYMAPEMAIGPIQDVDARSDVYLLGAILYEIVTGKPPHTGPNVMGCLFAAAHNQIVPTSKDDELVDIARRAMATRREDRYQSVKEFQNSLREYQSHNESNLLSDVAKKDLEEARETKDYQKFAEAQFGFQQALELWPGNRPAAEGLRVAKLSYAEAAVDKGDVDLALSLIDVDSPDQAALHRRALALRQERDQRQQRLQAAKRMALALTALVFVIGIAAFIQIRSQRDRARDAENTALEDRKIAVSAGELAENNAKIAQMEALNARRAEEQVKQEYQRAEEARKNALTAAQQAKVAETQAKQRAEEARAAREAESYEAYVARIGLASAKIEENSFGTAVQLLNDCEQKWRRWEWGRLMYLCGQNVATFTAEQPFDSVAVSPDGKSLAGASWDGLARIWQIADPSHPLEIDYGSPYVHAVAFSPDGKFLAVGGSNPEAFVQLRDAATGALVRAFHGHDDAVLDVAFSSDGRRLLTCSYDQTAKLWDVETGGELQSFEGHTWWVWSAAFAPLASPGAEETRIVTAGQDGTVLVWDVASGKPLPAFTGHDGPVYTAVFSPDGKYVVSGGADKRLLLWDPAKLRPFDFESLTEDKPPKPPEYVALEDHAAAVRSAAFSRDGRLLVSAGHDNTVKVWDVAARTPVKTLRGHAGWVRSAAFSSDAAQIASAGHDRRILLWNLAEYVEQRVIGTRTLAGHSDAVLYAAFAPGDAQIATAARDHTARLWSAADGKPLAQFVEGHAFLASQAAFLPAPGSASTPARIVTAGIDNTARVWDVEKGVELFHVEPAGRAAALAVSQDGKYFLTGTDRDSAILWDAATGRQVLELAAQGDEVVWAAFSPDDEILFTGESAGACRLWRRIDGKLLHNLKGHDDRITGAGFTADGRRLLTSSIDNTVLQWDVADGTQLSDLTFKHPAAVSSLAVTSDGVLALTGCGDGKVRVWNVAGARVVRTLLEGEGSQNVAVSTDGARALTTDSVRRIVRLWDLTTGREISPAGKSNAAPNVPFLDIAARREFVWCGLFSPDASQILTVGGDGAKLWSAADGAELKQFSPHGAVASVAFSPDGRRIVTGSWDRSARIWDVAAAKALVKLAQVHDANINQVSFSPDGKRILTASDDGTARPFDAETGRALDLVLRHDAAVHDARFSTDGRRIVTAAADARARIWDAHTGTLIKELVGHGGPVLACVFSRDGKLIATGGGDNIAIVWDGATYGKIAQMSGHTAGVSSVAFTADGDRLLTGSQDNLAKLWDSLRGKEIMTLKDHTEEITSVHFSHAGNHALTSARDGTAIVWPAVDWGWGRVEEGPLAPDAKLSPETAR